MSPSLSVSIFICLYLYMSPSLSVSIFIWFYPSMSLPFYVSSLLCLSLSVTILLCKYLSLFRCESLSLCLTHAHSQKFPLRRFLCFSFSNSSKSYNYPRMCSVGVLQKYARLESRYSSVVSFAPTILRPWVQISSTPSTLYPIIVSFCTIFGIVLRKWRK